jgi:hypothetical protein
MPLSRQEREGEMTKVKEPSQSEVPQKADPDQQIRMDREDSEKADKSLCKLFGTDYPGVARGLARQLDKLSFVNGKLSKEDFDFFVSFVMGGKPRDQFEAILFAQMAAIHKAMMDETSRLNQPNADRAEIVSSINKLARTFAMLLDTLKRYRSKGEQQVTVQHVTVGQGGQAIVGDVHQQQRDEAKASAAAPALTHSNEQPMQPLAEVPKEVVMVKKGTRK